MEYNAQITYYKKMIVFEIKDRVVYVGGYTNCRTLWTTSASNNFDAHSTTVTWLSDTCFAGSQQNETRLIDADEQGDNRP